MATKISAGKGIRVEAQPWTEGKLNVGFLVEAAQPPRCESMKYTLELPGGLYNACWGTGALDTQMRQIKIGECVRIQCQGKGEPFQTMGKEGKMITVTAWQFDVTKADNQVDVDAFDKEYRAYVAGGGK
jgi:hypothetical protein